MSAKSSEPRSFQKLQLGRCCSASRRRLRCFRSCCSVWVNHSNTQVFVWVLFSAVYHRRIILLRYDIHHLSSSLYVLKSEPPYHLQASQYNLRIYKGRSRPPAQWPTLQTILHPQNGGGGSAGSEKRPECSSHPQTHPFPHLNSPLLTLPPHAAVWLCVLAPVQVLVLWWGGSRFASDPGPASWMLLLLVLRAPRAGRPLGRRNCRALERL